MSCHEDATAVYECWLEVTKQKRYHDKWLTDETYYRAIKAQFPTVESLGFDRGKMNRAISTRGGTTLDNRRHQSNHSGRETRPFDPFGNLKRDVWGYYDTTPRRQVERPPSENHSFLSLAQDKTIGDHYSVVRGVPWVVDLANEIVEQSSMKRKAEVYATNVNAKAYL